MLCIAFFNKFFLLLSLYFYITWRLDKYTGTIVCMNTGSFIGPSGISDLRGTVAAIATTAGGGEHVNSGRGTPSFCVSVRYTVRNLRCTVKINSVLANSKTQNAFLSPVHAMFRHDCPLAVKPASTPRCQLPPPPQKKEEKYWRDFLPIDMLLSAVSLLVVAVPSSQVSEGLMNYAV
jgi:hypothetical protein